MKNMKLHKTIHSLRLPKHHITAQDVEINAGSRRVSQHFSICKNISTQLQLLNKRLATEELLKTQSPVSSYRTFSSIAHLATEISTLNTEIV